MTNNEKLSRIRKNHFFSMGDIIVYVLLIVLIAVFTLFAFWQNNKKGEYFDVLYNGEKVFSAVLNKDGYYTFYIENYKGKVVEGKNTKELSNYNVIEVKNGKVTVVLSDCPDKVCYTGGVCLPHNMTIKVHYDGLESDI